MIQNKEDHQEDEKEEEEERGKGNDGDNINDKPYKKEKIKARSDKWRLIITSSDDETHIKGNSKNNSSNNELQILPSDDESLLIHKLKTQKSIKTKQRNNKSSFNKKTKTKTIKIDSNFEVFFYVLTFILMSHLAFPYL